MTKNEKLYPISLILPLVLFMVLGAAESYLMKLEGFFLSYPAFYSLKILLVAVSVFCCFPIWIKSFRPTWTRWTFGALAGGILAAGLWVLLSQIPVSILGNSGGRAAFNPFESCDSMSAAWSFWCVRMAGLALVVPLIEEMFLRGFLLRFIDSEDWRTHPVGQYSSKAWIAVCVYAAVTHPELIAAITWFSLATWLVSRTKNIWDAVIFHVGTNAALGVYVLFSGAWHLL